MSNAVIQQCSCPRCNAVGRSVGAMNYSETQVWDRSGRFSGSGVGITTGGIGFGVGSGSYTEHGEAASKRAATFSEPERISLPILPVVGFMLFAAIAVKIGPSMLAVIAPPGGDAGGTSVDMFDAFRPVAEVVGSIGGVAMVGLALYRFFKMQKEEDRLNETVYPAQLARYQELQYCENCHSIFDRRGNSADANENGFSAMMGINAGHRAVTAA